LRIKIFGNGAAGSWSVVLGIFSFEFVWDLLLIFVIFKANFTVSVYFRWLTRNGARELRDL
jgi:hypothetical protein